jgi:hypothetical protein
VKFAEEALRWLFEALGSWLRAVTHPVATLNDLLQPAPDSRNILAPAKVWLPAILIGMVFSLPVLKLFGIKWDSIDYHLAYWTAYLLALLALAFVAHLTLIVLRLKSEFLRTMVMVVTPILTYAPIGYLISLPNTLKMLGKIKALKEQKVPVDSAIATLFHDHWTADPAAAIALQSVAVSVSWVMLVACATLSAEAVTQWYGNDRVRSYSAVSVAWCIGMAVWFVLMPIQILTFYSAVG